MNDRNSILNSAALYDAIQKNLASLGEGVKSYLPMLKVYKEWSGDDFSRRGKPSFLELLSKNRVAYKYIDGEVWIDLRTLNSVFYSREGKMRFHGNYEIRFLIFLAVVNCDKWGVGKGGAWIDGYETSSKTIAESASQNTLFSDVFDSENVSLNVDDTSDYSFADSDLSFSTSIQGA